MRCPICEDELIAEFEVFVEVGEWPGFCRTDHDDQSQDYDEEFSTDLYRCDNGHRILIAPQTTPKQHPNNTQRNGV